MAEFTFVEKRPLDGREHVIEADVTIGREGCDVVLSDPEVSRRHAALRVTAGGPAVEDLGSSNGTFENGERVEGTRPLSDGDNVRFGNTEWQLRSTATAGLGAPQVTAARAIPVDATAAPPARPAPPAQAPAAAAQASAAVAPEAAPAEPEASQPRGDVPAPPEITPSAIHRTLPASAASAPPAFAPVGTRHTTGSAATRTGYTAFCMAVFVLTIAALAVYFILN